MALDLVIKDVRIFTGGSLSGLRDIAISDGRIAERPAPAARAFDGGGGTLLPGLIDTHVHVTARRDLLAYGRWGITTVLDMGSPDWGLALQLRATSDTAGMRSAGTVASAVKGRAVRSMHYPASSAVEGPQDAARFVAERTAEGVDHIKIVIEERLPFQPAPLDAATVEALVAEAHRAGLVVCVHATSVASFEIAARAGADVLTHAPLASALSDAQAHDIAQRGTAVSPTLVMMKKLIERFPAPIKPRRITYDNAVQSVRALHRAGARILAGTDANSDPTAPNTIEHGASLHDELELLVAAGLTPAEALRSATETAAEAFGLSDRGAVIVGRRADLLLVQGDPTTDISTTREIRATWLAGRLIR